MLNFSAARIYLCLEPTDMRKSFDTLAALVREHLQGDPQSGTWFVFRGKQGNRLKILYWDRDGYALWHKRLEQGTFEFPKVIGDAAGVSISPTELALLQEKVLAANIVNTDDTPVPVQDPDREHCRIGRIWAYVSRHGTVYEATEDRSRDGPLAFLQGYQGFLQCDAYAGYDELFRRSQGTIIEVGCWAHARRKFVEAQKTSPREAHEAVVRIKQLYGVEHEAKEFDVAARMSLRQEKSLPLLSSLKDWLDPLAVTALPKSPLGEAVTYARNQWAALNVYVTDGALAMDNNLAERAVKPFAIGRKNWLFFGNDDGGRRLAILSSFTATCQQFGVNPWTWLKDTLTRLPVTPADQLAALLPTPAE